VTETPTTQRSANPADNAGNDTPPVSSDQLTTILDLSRPILMALPQHISERDRSVIIARGLGMSTRHIARITSLSDGIVRGIISRNPAEISEVERLRNVIVSGFARACMSGILLTIYDALPTLPRKLNSGSIISLVSAARGLAQLCSQLDAAQDRQQQSTPPAGKVRPKALIDAVVALRSVSQS